MKQKQTATNDDIAKELFGADVVLAHTPYCTVRQQETQHLIYNNKTDEMHLVSPTGAYIYELCDGLSSVGDIEYSIVNVIDGDKINARITVHQFLRQLVSRGILCEVSDVVKV